MNMASSLISSRSMASDTWDSDNINAIMNALLLVENYPGVMERQRELQVWAVRKAKSIAANDLLKVMTSSEQKLNLAAIKHNFDNAGAWTDPMWEQFPSFLRRLIQSLVMQAGFDKISNMVGWLV